MTKVFVILKCQALCLVGFDSFTLYYVNSVGKYLN